MVFKKSFFLFVLLILCVLLPQFIFAQNESNQFIQSIEWENVEYATQYGIVLEQKNVLNAWEVYDSFEVTTNSLELTLGAGNYRYNITVYNVFGRAEPTSDWYTFTIEKALQPVVTDIFPRELDLSADTKNDEKAVISLDPKDVSQEAIFFLQRTEGNKKLYGKFIGFDENGMMEIEFETDMLHEGDYELIVQDPSGLTSKNLSTTNILNVERYSPSYLNISAGYTYSLFPPIANTLFEDYTFPSKNITARAKISYIPFVSPQIGSLGFEVSTTISNNTFTLNDIDITGFIFPVTLNLVYHKQISENFVFVTNLGAGSTFLYNFFEKSTSTIIPNAASIAVSGGLSIQFFIVNNLFVELGADYVFSYFLAGTSFHTVLPTFSIGWKFD